MILRFGGYSFFALTRTSSRTPTLPKSCRSAAVSISLSSSSANLEPAYGPVSIPETTSASLRVSAATRKECPEVVGSRCSIACTDARTKPSKMRLISSYRSAFSIATPACDASVSTSSRLRASIGTTSRSKSPGESSREDGLRFLLMSCTTPSTSPAWLIIGTASTEQVR